MCVRDAMPLLHHSPPPPPTSPALTICSGALPTSRNNGWITKVFFVPVCYSFGSRSREIEVDFVLRLMWDIHSLLINFLSNINRLINFKFLTLPSNDYKDCVCICEPSYSCYFSVYCTDKSRYLVLRGPIF